MSPCPPPHAPPSPPITPLLPLCEYEKSLPLTTRHRLLDKIAKQILVCENKTIRPWGGSIGEYKNYLRKKMISSGAV